MSEFEVSKFLIERTDDQETKFYKMLRLALGIDVPQPYDRTLRWLAGWDWRTVDAFVQLIKDARDDAARSAVRRYIADGTTPWVPMPDDD